MTEYSRVSETVFGLKHNASRAARKIPGAVVFPEGDGFRWGVPVGAEEVPDKDLRVDEALVDVVEVYGPPAPEDDEQSPEAIRQRQAERLAAERQEVPPEVIAEQRAEDAAAFEDLDGSGDDAEDDGCPKGDPDCYAANDACHDACSTFAERAAAEQPPAAPPLPTEATNEALAQAARDQAVILDPSSPETAWLLRTIADRLLVAPKPRAAALRSGGEARAERAPRAPKQAMAPESPPVITSPTNQGVQRLIDRIAAARHNLPALRAFTFKPSSTYYALAHRYLQACIAEAEASAPGAA